MPGKSYRRRLRSLLSCLYDVSQAPINSLVRSFFTSALDSFCFRVWYGCQLFGICFVFPSPLFHFYFFFFLFLFFFFFFFSFVVYAATLYCWSQFGSLTCTQMSMHVIAHGGCANSERKSAPKVDFGREENPLPQRRFEHAWQLQSTKSSHSELKTRLRTFLFRQWFFVCLFFVFFVFVFLFT